MAECVEGLQRQRVTVGALLRAIMQYAERLRRSQRNVPDHLLEHLQCLTRPPHPTPSLTDAQHGLSSEEQQSGDEAKMAESQEKASEGTAETQSSLAAEEWTESEGLAVEMDDSLGEVELVRDSLEAKEDGEGETAGEAEEGPSSSLSTEWR